MDHPTFEGNVFLMRFMGIYGPRSDWGFLRKVVHYFGAAVGFLSLFGGVAANFLHIILIENYEKISDVAMNIMYLEIFASIAIRMVYLALNNPDIDHLARRLVAEFRESTEFSFEPKTMAKTKAISNWLIKCWTLFVMFVGVVLSSSCIWKNPRALPYDIWLWYDLDSDCNYWLSFVVALISIEVMLVGSATLETINTTFILLTSTQVDILATDFRNIIHDALKKNGCTEEEILDYLSYENDESPSNHNRIEQNEKIDRTLETVSCKRDLLANINFCIDHHQKLLSFMDEYQSFISPYLMIEIDFNFTYLIFMLFVLATTEDTSMYGALLLAIGGVISQIFLVMFFGERLTSSIERLREKFYEIPWYLCDKHFLANYKITQIRMCKIMVVTAGKLLEVTLDTFLEFMKKAFSFFSVLRQMN